MAEASDYDPRAEAAQSRLREGIQRTRELCAEAKRRLKELGAPEGPPGPENLAQ